MSATVQFNRTFEARYARVAGIGSLVVLYITQWAASDSGSIPVLHSGGRGSIPRWSTNRVVSKPSGGGKRLQNA